MCRHQAKYFSGLRQRLQQRRLTNKDIISTSVAAPSLQFILSRAFILSWLTQNSLLSRRVFTDFHIFTLSCLNCKVSENRTFKGQRNVRLFFT